VAVTRVADIAEYIAERCRVYDEALAADLRRLSAVHGSSSVTAALQMLEERAGKAGSESDREGHRAAVREGVARTLALRRLSAAYRV
jgi:N-formylglutamate amidohydrolase